MPFKNPLANAAGAFLLLLSYVLPESWIAHAARYLGLGIIGLGLVLHAFAGYRRRRQFWTADSWRRYLLMTAIPLAAFGGMITMMALVEWGHPIAGAARSTARSIWVGGIVAFMLVGAGGLVLVIQWLHDGEASHPFPLRPWLRGGWREGR